MKAKKLKISLDSYGSFLGREKGCLIIRDREGKIQKFPLFENEIREVRLRSGNSVSVGALVTLGFWRIDCLFLTGRGNPVGILKSLDDDSHVSTRISQYEAFKNKKVELAQKFVLGRIEGQNEVLEKYGLRKHDCSMVEKVTSLHEDNLSLAGMKLTGYEGKCSEKYFGQIFGLITESIRPKKRKKFKAYDGLNNLLNLAYEMLKWKIHIALIGARLEPYLGFLHNAEFGKPALICDFEELYRHIIEDFIIQYSVKLKPKDFVLKDEYYAVNRKGKRQYLREAKTRDFMKRLDQHFRTRVGIPRLTHGNKQRIETLISEEASLFAMYLRNERKTWNPRIVSL